MPDRKPSDETYSEQETVARRENTLRRMLSTPPNPHKANGKKKKGKAKTTAAK